MSVGTRSRGKNTIGTEPQMASSGSAGTGNAHYQSKGAGVSRPLAELDFAPVRA
jgi:hypothetical protein